MSLLIERKAKSYQKEISKLLMFEAKDECLSSVTVTEVRITNDLSYATIYYICPTFVKDKVKDSLERAKGYLRSSLAKRVLTRKSPELIFKYDEAFEYGNHINEIINDLHKKEMEK